MPTELDENVTKLHIPHSVQSSPSLLGNKQFLEVSRFRVGFFELRMFKTSPLGFSSSEVSAHQMAPGGVIAH